MPCSSSSIVIDNNTKINPITDNGYYNKFQHIEKCDPRFQNILFLIEDDYYIAQDDTKLLVNCILDIKQNNDFLESFPFDY